MRLNLLATCAAIAIVPSAALAQTAPAPAEEHGPTSSAGSPLTAAPVNSIGLSDIIVTAQRRAESSQRAAVAIDVVTGSDVVAAGISDVRDLTKLVPSLSIQNIGPSNASFIRGVGNFSVAVTADPAVAFNYDGVYIGRQTSTSGTFYDLDRIEVLKGPQGTLYGRNATAGVINVLPTQPKLRQLGGYLTASYGNYHAFTGEGAINVPIGENAAFRVSGTVTDRDGYLNDGTSDAKAHGLRAQMKANLTPDLTVRIAGDYTHLGGKGAGFTFVDRQIPNTAAYLAANGFNPRAATVAAIKAQNFIIIPTNFSFSEGPTSPASQAYFTSLPAGAQAIAGRNRDPFPSLYQDSNFYGVNADIAYNMGFATLTVIPAYRWDHVRNRNGSAAFPISNDQIDKQYSLEGRLAGKVGMFDYTLGAFFFDEHNLLHNGTTTFGSNASISFTDQKIQSWAPFARLTANVTKQLRLVGGIRYTHDKKSFGFAGTRITPSCTRPATVGGCPGLVLPTNVLDFAELPFPIPAAGGPPTLVPATGAQYTRADDAINARLVNKKFTYRAAVEYDLAPASLLYASFETGFRSGGFNSLTDYETFQPEFITAYTLGAKNRFFDNRVQFNVEAFYWKYRNQQASHPFTDRNGRSGSLTENIGRSTIKGVEVDVRVKATRNTVLSATVAYLDARNKAFVYTLPTQLGTLTGCAVTPDPAPPSPLAPVGRIIINCSGNRSFNAPKLAINMAAEQTIPLGEYAVVLGVDTQYKSRRILGFEYQRGQEQAPSWTTNAQISFGPTNKMWSIAGYVRNIEGDRLLAAPFLFGGLSVAYSTAPRTYGVRGSVRF